MTGEAGHYGVQLWAPEAGGRIDFHAEEHEQMMLALGSSSRREITRTRIRVRAAMAAQTREQGRYLGSRPPYGYRLADAGLHPNKAHAAWGRRAHRLEPDPETAPVVRWMFAQRLAGRSAARITPAWARLRTGAFSAIMAPCLAFRSRMCPSRLMPSCASVRPPRTSLSRST